jgi:hypothetical protein
VRQPAGPIAEGAHRAVALRSRLPSHRRRHWPGLAAARSPPAGGNRSRIPVEVEAATSGPLSGWRPAAWAVDASQGVRTLQCRCVSGIICKPRPPSPHGAAADLWSARRA